MRRLRAGQPVALELDSATGPVPCTVLAVSGAVALLSVAESALPRAAGCIANSSRGFLVFSDHGATVALRGAASIVEGQPIVRFGVTDGIQLPERRAANRTAIETRAVIVPLDDDRAEHARLETRTINVSSLGFLLQRPAGLDRAERVRVELYPGHDATPIKVVGEVVRSDDTTVAVELVAAADQPSVRR